jgi:N-acetylglucosaminyldiphosphoundecaprenol N-acetyl-beta-D-mannosaminyltransferase
LNLEYIFDMLKALFDSISYYDRKLDALILEINKSSREKRDFRILTLNPEFLLFLANNETARRLLKHFNIFTVDGFGLQLMILLFKKKWLERVTGVEIVASIIQTDITKNMVIIGRPDSWKGYDGQGILSLGDKKIRVIDPGNLDELQDADLEDLIHQNNLRAQIVLIALPMKHQILIGYRAKGVIIGVGGALDMLCGDLPRCPLFMRRIGLEWLWRLYLEPSRIGRIINAVLVFPFILIRDNVSFIFNKYE